jgi:hypothetical protein
LLRRDLRAGLYIELEAAGRAEPANRRRPERLHGRLANLTALLPHEGGDVVGTHVTIVPVLQAHEARRDARLVAAADKIGAVEHRYVLQRGLLLYLVTQV